MAGKQQQQEQTAVVVDPQEEIKRLEAKLKEMREQVRAAKAGKLPEYEVMSLVRRAVKYAKAGETTEQAIDHVLQEYKQAMTARVVPHAESAAVDGQASQQGA